jgi:YVTN family beta-propeller protein
MVAAVLPATAEARRNVYVTGNTSSTIAAFDVAAGGALSPVTGSPFATGLNPRGVSLTPDGAHAYVANETADSVTTFSVGANGALTPVGAASPVGDMPRAVAPSPDGTHLYVSNAGAGAGGNSVSAFNIGAGGALTPVAGSPFAAGTEPQGIALTPDGKFLYVANRGAGTLSAFAVAASGALTPLVPPTAAVGTQPRGVSVTPDGHHLYVANSASDTVSAFDVAASGALTPIGAPSSTGTTPDDVTITPNGAFLYTANENNDNVSSFTIAAGGNLTPLATVPTGPGPATGGVTPDGRHLYLADFGNDTITGFDIGSGGGLTAIPGTPFASTVNTNGFLSLAITPDQGPTAAFTATAAPAGRATTFNGAGSSDADGAVARFDWSFGDGQSLADGGPTPSHTYSSAGTYTATLTVIDDEGCAATQVFTGHIVLCNGSARAVSQQQVVVVDAKPPKLTLSGKKSQKADAAVEVTVSCDERCDVVAKGKLTVALSASKSAQSAKFKLKKAKASVNKGNRKTLHLKLPKPAKAAFENGTASSGNAKLKVPATDAAGNKAAKSRTVKLKPKR